MSNSYKNNNKTKNIHNNKENLPELFKELQDIKNGRIKSYEISNEKKKVKTKFNPIVIISILIILIVFVMILTSNYIFAKTEDEPKEAIAEFEVNRNSLDLNQIISENISEVTKKELVTKEENIPFEISYVVNNQLPKDEQNIIQEGIEGIKEIVVINTYENNELLDENIIKETIKQKSRKQITEVGTSEFLAKQKVHIGDTLYTKKEIELTTDGTEKICMIYEYIDLKLLEVGEENCKICVDGLEGYVKTNALVSSNIEPEIVEKNRIKRILINVYFDMPLNVPSGLNIEDYKKVFSNNIKDTNKIFENNAELFYNIEQKYKINGLFVAAIGIHESNWGNSTIAKEKNNLFGFGAYDSSPYSSASIFDSYESGTEFVAKHLVKYYINEPGTKIYDGETAVGSYYNGSNVSSVNVRYASDQNWANRVFSIMQGLYEKLQ